MKKDLKQGIVAIGLAFVMLFQAAPMNLLEVLAEEIQEVFATEENSSHNPEEILTGGLSDANNVGNGYIINENVHRRTETTKEFLMSDDTIMVQQFVEPVHYLENGEYKEIDNSLVAEMVDGSREVYKNRSNSFKVQFSKEFTTNSNFIEIEENGYGISFGYKDKETNREKVKTTVGNSKGKEKSSYGGKQIKHPLENRIPTGKMMYENIEKEIDITYEVQNKKLKENIVVNERQEEYIYLFELMSDNLYFTKNEDGSIYASTRQGEVKFWIPAPFMLDATGKYSDCVYYELQTKGNNVTELTIIADATWINTQAEFPVTIDPIIESYTETDFSYVNVYENGTKTTTGNIYIGKKDGVMSHAFLNFDVGTKGTEYALVDATLDFTYGIGNNKNVYCNVYTIDNDVGFSSITYTNRPTKLEYLEEINQNAWIQPDYETYSTSIRASNIQYDKLKIGIECLDDTTNNGYIVLYPSGEYIPSLNLRYKYISGLEDDYNMETFEIDGATAYVNNASGLLTLNCDLASINTMGNMSLVASLVYNSGYDSTLSDWGITDNPFGNNFKLNFQQYVRKDETGVYQLLDADGSIVTFYERPSGGGFYDSYSKNLSILVNGIGATVFDAQNNQMLFEYGRLKKIIPANCVGNPPNDASGPYIAINYVKQGSFDTNIIESVSYQDASGFVIAKIQFTYEEGRILINTSYKSVNLMQYEINIDEDGNLTTIKNLNENLNNFLFNYVNSDEILLASVFNYQRDGFSFSYPKYDDRIWKVQSIKGQDLTNDLTRFYDYAEFNYDNYATTKVIYYNRGFTSVIKKVCFNTSRRAISQWIEDENGNITVSNSGNWKAVLEEYMPDYVQENYIYREELNTSVVGTKTLSAGSSFTGIIPSATTNITDFNYYKYALSFKITCRSGFDLIVSIADEDHQVELVNGGELYVSIPCEYAHSGMTFTITNMSSIYNVEISNIGYGIVDYTKVRKSFDDAKYSYLIAESVNYSLNGEYAKHTYDAIQRIKTVETQNVIDTELKTTEYTYLIPVAVSERVELEPIEVWDIAAIKKIEAKNSEDAVLSISNYLNEYQNNTQSTTITTTSGSCQTKSSTKVSTLDNNQTLVEETNENNLTTKSYYEPHNGDVRLVKKEYGDTREEYTYNNWGQVTQLNIYGIASNALIYTQTNVYEDGLYCYSIYDNDTYKFVEESNTGIITAVQYNGNNKLTYTYNEPNCHNDTQALTKKVYANGQVEEYTYGLNTISITNRASATASSNASYIYTLGSTGTVTKQSVQLNGATDLSYVYGQSNNGKTQSLTINRMTHSFDYTETYDNAGRIKETSLFSMTSCGDMRLYGDTYTYNGKGQIEKMTYGTHTTELMYDELGRISRYTAGRQNNRYVYRTYTEGDITYTTNQLIRIEDLECSIGDCTSGYNDDGYIIGVSYNNRNYSYGYDDLGRLSTETSYNTQVTTYTYDGSNNITSRVIEDASHDYRESYTYQYDEENRLTKVKKDNLDLYAFSYDALGNPIVYKGNEFTWEQGRKLASGTLNGNSFAYNYDGNGMRYKKVVNGKTTEYYLNGSKILMENRIDNGGRIHYIYDVLGIAGMVYNDATYYFDKNTLGDVIAIRNQHGAIVGKYEYDAWGNILYQEGSIAEINPFRYRGYYYDNETGFYYLQTRYYDPTICRFINADNYELVAQLSSVAGQLNMYAYANNNPIMLTDETGEGIFSIALFITGCIIGAGYGALSAYVAEENILAGAITGGIIGGLSAGFGLSAFATALLNMGGSLITDYINYKEIYIDKAIYVGTVSWMMGSVFGSVEKYLEKDIISQVFGSTVLNTVFGGLEFGVQLGAPSNMAINLSKSNYGNSITPNVEASKFYLIQYQGV